MRVVSLAAWLAIALLAMPGNGGEPDVPVRAAGARATNAGEGIPKALLILNRLDAYARVGGNWVSVQSLLGSREYVPFDHGYVSQTVIAPEPGTLLLLATGGAALLTCARRRRR